MEDAELALLDAYWRAANYLTVGQISLLDNALLREPLTSDHMPEVRDWRWSGP